MREDGEAQLTQGLRHRPRIVRRVAQGRLPVGAVTDYERELRLFSWFLGANRLGQSLYDFSTAGCRDGLGSTEVNQNQGAESTLCFLLSLLAMLELADEGLEHDASLEGRN